MITQDKVIEIYSSADDFCKFFSTQIKNHLLQTPSKNTKISSRQCDVWCWNHYYSSAFPYDGLPLPETLLPKPRVYAYEWCLSQHSLLQSLCRITTIGNATSYDIYQGGFIGTVHRYYSRWFDTITRLSPAKNPLSQSFRRHCHSWTVSYGLVLWIQTASDLQWQRWVVKLCFTPANTDDREPLSYENFMKTVKGKLVGDKGYISRKLFDRLFIDGIQLITKIKENMKNCLMSSYDKILLRKRAII